jgi:hypothetical protein
VKYFILLFGTISKLLTSKTKDEIHKCITKRSARKYVRLRRLILEEGAGGGGGGIRAGGKKFCWLIKILDLQIRKNVN